MHHVLLAAAAAILLSACAAPTETLAERPAVKCDVVEPGVGSRIPKRENCVRTP
ncbi:hypothetical protein LZ009_01960 [Ramlibacter sp. XY19]|uniref:hypothetical protein n=1 Tax=Ramlibacter paludis TaxID=2908000 RepID=UPI0023DA4D09|nr:hypothetical protein [Ramlibacter paludis]MCG2591546.1 hypothetical protein [Ramlibacter paludis]